MHDHLPPSIPAATAVTAAAGVSIVAALCLTPSSVQAVMVEVVADYTLVIIAAVAASALVAAVVRP